MKNALNKTCSLILTVILLLYIFPVISVNAATLPFEVKGKTISQVLGMNPQTYMDWLTSHANDNYYIGTTYKPYDHRNPKGDCKSAYGNADIKGTAAMNCTGFVWHVLYKATKSSGGNTSIIPALSGWYSFYTSNNISRKYFSSKSEMLKSGYLEKGDIIWMFNGSETAVSDYHHIGIYWGNDSNSDVLWHSIDSVDNKSGNIQSAITPISRNPLYVVIKLGVSPTSSITLGVGETYTLDNLNLKSSDTSVATVSSSKITAKKVGTANITSKASNGKTITCKVTVKSAPNSVKVNTSNLTLGTGETFIISESTNSGSYAKSFTWSSSNTDVATVKKTTANKAEITTKSNGTAYITIKTYNGKTATCKVTVKSAPNSVKVDTSSVTLGTGETFEISESTNSGSYSKYFTWSSNNTAVATVKKTTANKAEITAKSNGTAYITIKTYNGKTATCKVTVKSAPKSVKVNTSSVTLGTGETFIISESTNSGSYAKSFTWSSSNTDVATVKKTTANKAEITAKSNGTAYITIKTYNGKNAACKVTVKSAPSSVKLSTSALTLGTGEKFIISESTNSGSYAKTFTWSSSNTDVATVKKTTANKAEIVAKSKGTATITIKTYNGKTADCIVNVPF